MNPDRGIERAAAATYAQRVAGIENEAWLRGQLASSVEISEIAKRAGVSRQTVYAWIRRFEIPRVQEANQRPTNTELAELYEQCQTTEELGALLDVSPETARRWLVDADIKRRRVRIDSDEVRRRRRDGATIARLASDFGVGNDTIRRRLDPTWEPFATPAKR